MIGWAQSRAEVRRAAIGRQREKKNAAGTAVRNAVLLPGLLIVDEEEQLVFLDWPADRAADLVLIQNLLLPPPSRLSKKPLAFKSVLRKNSQTLP